ncbi:hypothetical protein [Polaromonas aquatica]|uniref:hypothetical protein n=1 Tax=Polaromonas aquatica TaxID=332657 RepID=UPI003D647B59
MLLIAICEQSCGGLGLFCRFFSQFLLQFLLSSRPFGPASALMVAGVTFAPKTPFSSIKSASSPSRMCVSSYDIDSAIALAFLTTAVSARRGLAHQALSLSPLSFSLIFSWN